MTSKFKAALFDMDGTLLNSMRFWRLVGMEYLVAHDLPVPEWPASRLFGTSGHAMVTGVLEARGVPYDDAALVDELERRMSKYYQEDVRPKPGVVELLETLKAHDIPCAVATATPREIASAALDRHGLLKYFRFVTDGYELGTGKSDPEYFRAAARRLDATPEECWMFEDALYAIRGAKAAGMRVCVIEDVTAWQREEIRSLADIYVSSFAELLPGLERLYSRI